MGETNTIRFIGDVHGKYRRYKRLIKDSPPSIQVGDMGVGFKRAQDGEFMSGPPFDVMVEGNHRFIRGNHDNPAACRNHPQCVADGTYNTENGMMFIGGALSIDRAYRVEGLSWWRDEELSIEELNGLIGQYSIVTPRIMVTHECPESLTEVLTHNRAKIYDPSRTRQAFEQMLHIHKPAIWIFGHWHMNLDYCFNGTRFICLDELNYIDYNVDTGELGSIHPDSRSGEQAA